MSDTGSVPAARHRRRRIALLVLVVFAFLARRYLAELSPRLLPLSRRGLGGFMRYACGDYVGAAAAYGQNLREAFATAGLSVKNEEVALLAGDRQGARTLATNALARDPGAHSSLLTLGSSAHSSSLRPRSMGYCWRLSFTRGRATTPGPRA